MLSPPGPRRGGRPATLRRPATSAPSPTSANPSTRAPGPTVASKPTTESSTSAPAPIRPPGSTTEPESRAPGPTTARAMTTLSTIPASGATVAPGLSASSTTLTAPRHEVDVGLQVRAGRARVDPVRLGPQRVQAAVGRHGRERLPLHRDRPARGDASQNRGLQDVDAGVDPAAGGLAGRGLLDEPGHPAADVGLDHPELRGVGHRDGQDGGLGTTGPVQGQQLAQRDVGQHVAVERPERLGERIAPAGVAVAGGRRGGPRRGWRRRCRAARARWRSGGPRRRSGRRGRPQRRRRAGSRARAPRRRRPRQPASRRRARSSGGPRWAASAWAVGR